MNSWYADGLRFAFACFAFACFAFHSSFSDAGSAFHSARSFFVSSFPVSPGEKRSAERTLALRHGALAVLAEDAEAGLRRQFLLALLSLLRGARQLFRTNPQKQRGSYCRAFHSCISRS